jgi:hypothetical protein
VTAPGTLATLLDDGAGGLDGTRVLEVAKGLRGVPGTPGSAWHRAGRVVRDGLPPAAESLEVQRLVRGLAVVDGLWTAMTGGTDPPVRRDSIGPVREFDYNIDGLAHYGLLPDMLQDLRNVGLPQEALDSLFRSAGHYVDVWERSAAAGASIPHPT